MSCPAAHQPLKNTTNKTQDNQLSKGTINSPEGKLQQEVMHAMYELTRELSTSSRHRGIKQSRVHQLQSAGTGE
jgi:hypothetical protein